MGEKNQLMVPPRAKGDPKSFELIRAWVSGGDLHVSLEVGGWDDPSAWGVVLADVLRHVANFYEQQKGLDPEETAERIREAFDAEMESPGQAEGGVAE